MQTTVLPNGVEVFNATPHGITFYEDGWDEEVTVPSQEDSVISAFSNQKLVREKNGVRFIEVVFESKYEGERIIGEIRNRFPNALIVGSMVAAQAYAEDVVAPKPWFVPGGRKDKKSKTYNPSEFTIFLKKEQENNG